MTFELLDIIYCDSNRIETYLEQIKPREISSKFPNWLFEIQIPGFLKINLKNYLKISEMSKFEKSYKLLKFLQDNDRLGINRPDRQGENTPEFYFENCTATRMYFEHPEILIMVLAIGLQIMKISDLKMQMYQFKIIICSRIIQALKKISVILADSLF